MQLDAKLIDARITTLDEERPTATTMGIVHGRILGFDEDIADLPARTVIDAGGAAAVPGFFDAHCHTAWFGLALAALDLTRLPGGLPEVYRRIEEHAAGLGPFEWVNATGYAHRDYDDQYPDIEILDRISGGRPLFIRQTSGHAAIVNTEALRRAGVLEPGFEDPDGGRIVRDAEGRPTGLVEETAQELIQQLIRPYAKDEMVAAIERATRHYAGEGITSFTDAGIAAGWIGHTPVELAAYQQAADSGRLHARAELMPSIDALHPVTAHADDGITSGLDLGLRTGLGDDMVRIGPVKVFMDGALSGETAALTSNYTGRDHAGYLQAPREELRRKVLEAAAADWSLALHAIGDLAIDEAISIIAEAQQRYGRRDRPHRIEHAAVVRPEQLELLAREGIAVTPQAAFFESIGDGMAACLGPERVPWLYRGRSFLDSGVLLAGSSDRPCAEGNPLRGMQAYAERLTRSGAVLAADEALTAEEALRAYTIGSATAAGQQADKGTLTAGKLADFVLLSEAPMDVAPDEIAGLEILGTARGGQLYG